jgi:hypothetical protein
MLQYFNGQRGSGPGEARDADEGKVAKEEHERIYRPLREVSQGDSQGDEGFGDTSGEA